MSFNLNEEQQLLQRSAQDFFSKNMPVSELRKLRDSDDELGYSKSHWQQMVELGWTGIMVAEEYGGLDFGYQGLGLLLEASGRTLASSPLFSSCALGASALVIAGNEMQKSELLPSIVAGEILLALALEESASHGAERTKTRARKTAGGYQISGDKTFVLDGHVSQKLIVVARSSGEVGDKQGLTLFLLDTEAKGVTIDRLKMVDSRNASNIHFNNVEVSEAAILGTVNEAYEVLQNILSIGQICLAAEMLGGTQEAFERTVEYIKTRQQFDVHLGSFQSLQHRAAQMYVEIELIKSVVTEALSAIDEGVRGDELAKYASLAKAKVAQVYNLVSSEAVQMHGGIGMTDEEEIGFFIKRARVAEHTLGDIRYHQNRYGEMIGL